MTIAIPSAQITSTGVVVPDYADVLAAVRNLFGSIYGADTVLTPNTQDDQWLSVLSQAISNSNQGVGAAYNAFAPTFAQGAGLSSLVKINGLRRGVPTNSQIVVTITGTAGTQIINGQVGDNAGLNQVWNLPVSVIIPPAATIDVTATSSVPGAISAGASSLTRILTPTNGWQTVTNGSNAASLGAPVESDAALRRRQSVSTGQPAQTPEEAIAAEVANVSGVTASLIYDNRTSSTDGNGIPSHTVSAVVDGGDATAVAEAIFSKIAPGIGTYGTTTVSLTDSQGMVVNVNFFELAFTTIYVALTITPLAGYTSAVGAEIEAALAAWVSGIGSLDPVADAAAIAYLTANADAQVLAGLEIGADVFYTKLVAAACLFGTADGNTYNLTALTVATTPIPVATSDIVIAFNARASLVVGNITLTVT